MSRWEFDTEAEPLAKLKAENWELRSKLAHWIDVATTRNRRPLTDAEQEEAADLLGRDGLWNTIYD